MNLNTEVFLLVDNQWKELEIMNNIPFPLTYNIADIRDITKRNSTYSKTITIPGTKINNELFNFIFDISSISTFNVNKKVKCTIVVDTVPIITESYLQLNNIKSSDNIHFEYECVIIGETDDIVKSMGSNFLTDLDLSSYDHIYNGTTITQSWNNNYTSGYYYGLVDLGYNLNFQSISDIPGGGNSPANLGLRVEQMRPLIYAKTIWDRIFDSYGFSYYSPFLTSNQTFLNSVILGGGDLQHSSTYSYFNTFRASKGGTIQSVSLGANYTSKGGNPFSIGIIGNSDCLQWGMATSNVYIQTVNSPVYPNATITVTSNGQDVQSYTNFISSRIDFSDDANSPNGDPGNNWDTSLYEFTTGSEPLVTKFGVNFQMQGNAGLDNFFNGLDLLQNNWLSDPNNGVYFDLFMYRSGLKSNTNPNIYIPINANGGIYGTPVAFVSNFIIGGSPFPGPGTPPNGPGYPALNPNSQVNCSWTSPLFNQVGALSVATPYTPLQPGEKVWFKIVARGHKTSLLSGFNVEYVGNFATFAYNIVDSAVYSGQSLSLSSALPKNFKQIDFFTSIVKMFNLYIEPDRNNSKLLYIAPREEFYSIGEIVDWTDKVDIQSEVSQQIIADTQAKEFVFSHKTDSDYWNKYYSDNYKETYGEKIYDIDSDFIKGETKLETQFASTPILNIEGTGLLCPKIFQDASGQPKKEFLPRILQRYPNTIAKITTGTGYTLEYGDISANSGLYSFRFDGVNYPGYPYVGHFDRPYDGTSDINFGQTEILFYDFNVITPNQLFDVYYATQMEELSDKDSRIVTVKMRLTPQDINSFKFNHKIILNQISSGSINYFKVNKIEYDPTSKGLFTVELLKTRVMTRVPNKNGPRRSIRGDIQGPINSENSTHRIINVGNTNTIYGTSNIVNGQGNLLLGDVFESNIYGQNNNISNSNRVNIIGSSNSVVNANNVIGIGIDGMIISSDYNNSVIMGNQPIIVINLIDGSSDMILNPFGEISTINLIDSSMNTIKQLGSESILDQINSHINSI